MQWEFLGIQELRESHTANKGHVYALSMWRTPVQGGWLLMTINSRSNNPQPVQSFYPDPQHLWTGKTPAEANYLLRPAGAGALPAPDMLLIPAQKETGAE